MCLEKTYEIYGWQLAKCSRIQDFECVTFAGVAELADAPDLGSGGLSMQVQVLSPAPTYENYIAGTARNRLFYQTAWPMVFTVSFVMERTDYADSRNPGQFKIE